MPEDKKDQGTQQASPEEQKFKIKVQGEEKEVPLSELLELAQKGDDYTKKTQELSEKQKRMEEETQRKAEELVAQYLEQVEQEQQQQQQSSQATGNLDPQEQRIKKLEDKIAKMEGSTEETQVAQLELQYEKKLSDCKQKYPLMDEKVVLAILSANPELDMEELAKESHGNKEKERDAWIKDYLDSKSKQPKEAGGGSSALPLNPPKEMKGKDLLSGNVKRAATDYIRQSMEG